MEQRTLLRKLTLSLGAIGCLLPLLAFSELLVLGTMTDEGKYYPNPGIVVFRDNKWVGSDHLYNLSNQIDVAVEIFKPEKLVVPIKESEIREHIVEMFQKAHIEPAAASSYGKPPLPFFHVLIMIFQVEKGYVAYIEGRLLEQIHVDRIKLDEQAVMQGITWESNNLILSPTDDVAKQVQNSVDDIVKAFIERYQFYEGIRKQIKK